MHPCTGPSTVQGRKQAGTPHHLGGTEQGKGIWYRAGEVGWSGSLPGTGEPLRMCGQRRLGSEVFLRMVMVLDGPEGLANCP